MMRVSSVSIVSKLISRGSIKTVGFSPAADSGSAEAGRDGSWGASDARSSSRGRRHQGHRSSPIRTRWPQYGQGRWNSEGIRWGTVMTWVLS
jgi:hypothetical protein